MEHRSRVLNNLDSTYNWQPLPSNDTMFTFDLSRLVCSNRSYVNSYCCAVCGPSDRCILIKSCEFPLSILCSAAPHSRRSMLSSMLSKSELCTNLFLSTRRCSQRHSPQPVPQIMPRLTRLPLLLLPHFRRSHLQHTNHARRVLSLGLDDHNRPCLQIV